MTEIVHVALLADTHGWLDPRIAEVARACDLVVHAGDIGAACILEALGADHARVVAVSGNNDTARHWPAADRAALDGLPETATIDLPGGQLWIVHGHRLPARTRHRRLREQAPDAAAIVLGHSHRRAIEYTPAPWILNPGAAGRSRAYGGPGCFVLHATVDEWVVETHVFDPLPRRRRRPS
ncbi:metallophosphoesterase family protein [Halofilum ochraceum]|uniref:metallophosphoesterase family protein n=1 Tax=Halofilum ochraceum TaxID=1611323 RepID=UPI0008DA6330|nr:metallophosphoesterase family protein [Halofilum ochraceum]